MSAQVVTDLNWHKSSKLFYESQWLPFLDPGALQQHNKLDRIRKLQSRSYSRQILYLV